MESGVELESTAVLPFRGLVNPGSISLRIPGDNHDTTFSLSYRTRFPMPSSRALDTSSYTLIKLQTHTSSESLLGEPRRVVDQVILPKLNHFISYLKFSVECYPNLPEEFIPLSVGVFRNVGLADLPYVELAVDGRVIFRLASSSSWHSGDVRGSALPAPRKVEKFDAPPKEWNVFTRAVDLVNHGYYLEGFVVAYSLVDDKVQEFLGSRLPGKSLVLDANRFQQFWGPLMEQAVRRTPLSDPILAQEVNWLNSKRNRVMHAGEECTGEDAQRGLVVVHKLLSFLNRAGAGYVLPKRPYFLSPIELRTSSP